MEGHETLRGRMKFEGRLLKKTRKFCKKAAKNRCKFAIGKKQAKKALKNLIPCAAHVPPRFIVETKNRKEMPAGFFYSNSCTMSKNAAKSEKCANIWPTWLSKIEAGAPQVAKKTSPRHNKCSKTRKMRPSSAQERKMYQLRANLTKF